MGRTLFLTKIDNYYGYRFLFLLHNVLAFVDSQNSLFTIVAFLSYLGFLIAWWMLSRKENSKRKEMEAASLLKAGIRNPRISFLSYSVGQSNHRARVKEMEHELHFFLKLKYH